MTQPVHCADGMVTHVGSTSLALPSANQVLHGVALRPPSLSWDGQRYTGPRLTRIETTQARATPGVVQVVVRGDFIAVIASQPGQAAQASNRLDPQWATPISAPHETLGKNQPGLNVKPASGEPKAQSAGKANYEYTWPAASNTSAAWAIAHHTGDALTVWACTRHPDSLRNELAQLCGVAPESVRIISNGQSQVEAYDLAADASLLSQACGRPVRVQLGANHAPFAENLTLAQALPAARHKPNESTQAAAASELNVSANRSLVRRPSIAALLCGMQAHYQAEIALHLGDYPGQINYSVPTNIPLSELDPDGLSAAAQVFAHESFFDEACIQQNTDPVQARLETLKSGPGRDLVEAVASRAKWSDPSGKASAGTYQGKGFAYSHVIDHSQQPAREVWSAWVAEVRVDPATGAIDLTGLTVGHNSAATQASTHDQIENEVRQAATRWLTDATGFDTWGTTPQSSQDLALATADTTVHLVDQASLGLAWSPEAELPAAAAIANAIHNATGVRLRNPPFDPAELKQKLALGGGERRAKKTAYTLLGGIAAAMGGLLITAMPWRASIAPAANIDTSIYSAAAIERGRLVAAAGDCMVCHTAEGGQPNAGGLKLDTPFGTVVTTNITPDKETGIGSWSFAAFERAMRQGIHRDGRHLYPAFPYTAFAKMSEADMQSLYAYLMTQEPVRNQVEPTSLRFPYNVRPLLAGWNLLYHENKVFEPDPSKTTLWNRGAYLVQSMGHCAACHSPRNAMGAEKSGEENFLAGGFAEGWEAPALNALSRAPIPWSEDELYNYLRTGYSSLHGVASGPMAPVIQSMGELPDEDVRAVAHYLGALAPPNAGEVSPAMQAAQLEERSRNDLRVMSLAGENLFQGACAVCHDAREGPPLFGARPSLALNTNLHSDHPDNAIQILLHGIDNPAMAELGYMPGFGDSMNNDQLVTLLEYMRMRFAPDKPAWEGVAEKVQALRGE